MVISREEDYAIRIMRSLADGEMHVISQICQSEHIPRQYGSKIITKLQTAGLLHCVRGRGGGCRLNGDLKDITLMDILKAIDSKSCFHLCLVNDGACIWRHSHIEAGKIHTKLAALQDEISERLKTMDLHTLLYE